MSPKEQLRPFQSREGCPKGPWPPERAAASEQVALYEDFGGRIKNGCDHSYRITKEKKGTMK